MASISEEDQILDALTGPWTQQAYAKYLREVYGYTGLAGDEIQMNRGDYTLATHFDIITHVYTFHELEDKKRWLRGMDLDGDNNIWLNPQGGRHLVALLQEIDDPGNVREPQE